MAHLDRHFFYHRRPVAWSLRLLSSVILVFGFLFAGTRVASAQDTPTPETTGDVAIVVQQTSSVAEQERTIPGGVLVIAAYFVLWIMIFAFVAAVLKRQRQLERDLETVERRLDQIVEL